MDGFIARNWANQKSALGSALDPLADKILISVLYVSLTCANLIPGEKMSLCANAVLGKEVNPMCDNIASVSGRKTLYCSKL